MLCQNRRNKSKNVRIVKKEIKLFVENFAHGVQMLPEVKESVVPVAGVRQSKSMVSDAHVVTLYLSERLCGVFYLKKELKMIGFFNP